MAKTFKVEVTVPEGCVGGDTFEVEVSMPVAEPKTRGQLAGLSVQEMDDDQLKRELVNAKSVLYKAIKRGADAALIAANQARVDIALAEKASRAASGATTTPVETPVEEDTAYADAETASEM